MVYLRIGAILGLLFVFVISIANAAVQYTEGQSHLGKVWLTVAVFSFVGMLVCLFIAINTDDTALENRGS